MVIIVGPHLQHESYTCFLFSHEYKCTLSYSETAVYSAATTGQKDTSCMTFSEHVFYNGWWIDSHLLKSVLKRYSHVKMNRKILILLFFLCIAMKRLHVTSMWWETGSIRSETYGGMYSLVLLCVVLLSLFYYNTSHLLQHIPSYFVISTSVVWADMINLPLFWQPN